MRFCLTGGHVQPILLRQPAGHFRGRLAVAGPVPLLRLARASDGLHRVLRLLPSQRTGSGLAAETRPIAPVALPLQSRLHPSHTIRLFRVRLY